MNVKAVVMVFAGLVFLSMTPVVLAAPGLNPARIDHLGDKLGLSDDIVSQIKALAYANRKARIQIDGRLKEATLDLEVLMDQVKPDRAAIMKQLDTIANVQLERRKMSIGLLLDVAALLTPEQHRAFRKIMRARQAKRRGMRRGAGPHRQ